MLVLTRRPRQSIIFPTLGITVQILRISGQTTRIGVDAPLDIPILREELDRPDHTVVSPVVARLVEEEAARRVRHHLRGQLNKVTMGLYLAQKQLQAGLTTDAEDSLQQALTEVGKLENEFSVASGPHGQQARRPIQTLLVEDNAHESLLLESYLRLNGMEVANASDGQEALDYLSTHALPDAVLLDMRLPRCNGADTVAAIRGNPSFSRLKIFVVSGAKQEELNVPTGPTGVDGWFSKPLNPARLVETLALAFG